MVKLWILYSMFRNKIGMPALTSSIQYFTWGSSQYNQVMKRNKMLPNCKWWSTIVFILKLCDLQRKSSEIYQKNLLQLIIGINVHNYWPKKKGNIYLHKFWTQIFIEALFAIAKNWKQPKYSPAAEKINRLHYIGTMEYYSVMTRNKLLLCTTWVCLKIIILCEKSQRPQKIHAIWCYLYKSLQRINIYSDR